MTGIHYDLIRQQGKMCGLLLSDVESHTPIYGYEAEIELPASRCRLVKTGTLRTFAGFVWDFGSGPAIDTPAVIRASLDHDALCLLTDKGLIPWKCRAMADKYYRDSLAQYSPQIPTLRQVVDSKGVALAQAGPATFALARRWWQWAGVRVYSKTVAYWRRTKHETAGAQEMQIEVVSGIVNQMQKELDADSDS